jgi:sulfate transport system ATP-binding protein
LVRLELQSSSNSDIIEAELTREKYLNLNISLGSKVFVEPRRVRVFLDHKK